jgi:hypothetical protein
VDPPAAAIIALILFSCKRSQEQHDADQIGKTQLKRSLRMHGAQMEQICIFTGNSAHFR